MAESVRIMKVFFCYARVDEVLLNKLKTQLQGLVKQKFLSIWHDRDISAGTEWKKEIEKQLDAADIILLLISSDFMASDFCYGIEMTRAMERHERGEAWVIPIILRPVYWEKTPFGKLQALPTDGKAVIEPSWQHPDRAFHDIEKGVLALIEQLRLIRSFDEAHRADDDEKLIAAYNMIQKSLYKQAIPLSTTQKQRVKLAQQLVEVRAKLKEGRPWQIVEALSRMEFDAQKLTEDERKQLYLAQRFVSAYQADDEEKLVSALTELQQSSYLQTFLFLPEEQEYIKMAHQKVSAIQSVQRKLKEGVLQEIVEASTASFFDVQKLTIEEREHLKLVQNFLRAYQANDDEIIASAYQAMQQLSTKHIFAFSLEEQSRIEVALCRVTALQKVRAELREGWSQRIVEAATSPFFEIGKLSEKEQQQLLLAQEFVRAYLADGDATLIAAYQAIVTSSCTFTFSPEETRLIASAERRENLKGLYSFLYEFIDSELRLLEDVEETGDNDPSLWMSVGGLNDILNKLKNRSRVAITGMNNSDLNTLINSLLGNIFIPMSFASEMRIVVPTHNLQEELKGTLRDCGEVKARGSEEIYDYLQNLNAQTQNQKEQSMKHVLVLEAHMEAQANEPSNEQQFDILKLPPLDVVGRTLHSILIDVDIIFYMLDYTLLGTTAEERILLELGELLFLNSFEIFVVVDKIDAQNDMAPSLEKIADYIIQRLLQVTSMLHISAERVIIVNVEQALQARLVIHDQISQSALLYKKEALDAFKTEAFGKERGKFAKWEECQEEAPAMLKRSRVEKLEIEILRSIWDNQTPRYLRALVELSRLSALIYNTLVSRRAILADSLLNIREMLRKRISESEEMAKKHVEEIEKYSEEIEKDIEQGKSVEGKVHGIENVAQLRHHLKQSRIRVEQEVNALKQHIQKEEEGFKQRECMFDQQMDQAKRLFEAIEAQIPQFGKWRFRTL